MPPKCLLHLNKLLWESGGCLLAEPAAVTMSTRSVNGDLLESALSAPLERRPRAERGGHGAPSLCGAWCPLSCGEWLSRRGTVPRTHFSGGGSGGPPPAVGSRLPGSSVNPDGTSKLSSQMLPCGWEGGQLCSSRSLGSQIRSRITSPGALQSSGRDTCLVGSPAASL